MNDLFKNDAKLLSSINKIILDIKSVLSTYNLDFGMSGKSLCNNSFEFDLCAFYVIKISARTNMLTEYTRSYLNKFISRKTLLEFESMLSEGYEKVDRCKLQLFIKYLVSYDFSEILTNRIDFCNNSDNV